VNLARFLTEARVDLDLDGRFDPETHPLSVDSLSEHMAGLLASSDAVVNANKLRLDLVHRERRAPSLLGGGVALPHVRTLQARRLVMAVGLSRSGLALPTPDDQPLQLVVAIVGPPYDDRQYLQVYKLLSERLAEPGMLQEVLAARQPGEVVRLLSG